MSRLIGCCLLILLAAALIDAPAALAANPVQAENALPGDSYWTAATQDPVSANPPIAGYASANSVRPGATISFQVNTSPAARYRIEISRLGWYRGAGGRRITCLVESQLDPTCTLDRLGVQQPSPPPPDPATGEIRAGWSETDTLTVPAGWLTGYYLAVFRLTSGPAKGQTGFVPFIIQAPAGDRAAILVQVPTNTWQAYNAWGGQDFYTTPRAIKISFDRPYDHRLLFDWEYPLIRFLERGGWEVSYATDGDVDANPKILLDHSLDMSAGHDEYWTKAMRDGWEAARAAGVNLAVMGANDSFWQVRYEDGGRTLVGYKYTPDPNPDPAARTTEFRWLTPERSECRLFGVQFRGDVLINRNVDAAAGPAAAGDPWFAGTGLSPGSVITGLGGGEIDSIMPGCHVPPVTPLLTYSGTPLSDGTPVRGDAVRYTACSGAEVFSGGSLQFSWGLDSWRDPSYTGPGLVPVPPANPGLQQAMTRALADLTRSHVPVSGPPRICVPTAAIATPVGWAAVGQRIRFTSAAGDAYGEISSQRWEASLGRSSTTGSGQTFTRTFRRAGVAHLSLVVTDSSGASATTIKPLPVCRCPARGQHWPPAAQQGNPCQLMGIGSLRTANGGLWFSPYSAFKRFSITTYRIERRAGRFILVRLVSASAVRSSTPLVVRAAPQSMVVAVTTRVAGRLWRQQFLVAAGPGTAGALRGVLGETMCDGTSGQILSPAFGGPHTLPLRVAVTGRGRVVVTVAGARGRVLYRRELMATRKPVVASFGGIRLPRGLYRVTVAAWHSHLSQPVRLTALAL
jgi:hypothetical protein